MRIRHTTSLAGAAVLILANVLPSAGSDYFNPNFKTSSVAVLCVNPFNLKEALTAVVASDYKWIQSLNCLSLPVGLPVLRVQPDISSFTEPWQVRVQLPSGEAATLWGYHFSFTKPNGDKVTY
jgi:hypothetical protein